MSGGREGEDEGERARVRTRMRHIFMSSRLEGRWTSRGRQGEDDAECTGED